MVGRTFNVNSDIQDSSNPKGYGFTQDQSVETKWKLPIIGTLRFNPIVSFFSISLISKLSDSAVLNSALIFRVGKG